jgi:hypothetical protein
MRIIQCCAFDCKHNEHGFCECVWPNGQESIRISADGYCTDFEEEEEEE